jgi:uncharacterized protein (DUF736 family)
MASIGQVTRQGNGFKGFLKTLSFRANITIVPNPDKTAANQPDYRVLNEGAEIGSGWTRRSKSTGNEYVSLSLADPAFGPKTLYANLGRMAGQDDDEILAVIWNAKK